MAGVERAPFRRLSTLVAAVALAVATVACSGDDESGTSPPPSTEPTGTSDPTDETSDTTDITDGTGTEPSVTAGASDTGVDTASCDGDGRDVGADWPFRVSDAIIVGAATVDGQSYRLSGSTTAPDDVLVDTVDISFADSTVVEPDAPAGETVLEFGAPGSVGSLRLSDADGDGCWSVTVEAEFDDATGGVVGGGPTTTEAPDPVGGLEGIGTGQVLTGSGSRPLVVTTCRLDPVEIEAVSREVSVRIVASGATTLAVEYVDDDGRTRTDDDPTVLQLTPGAISVVADLVDDGPDETLIIELTCSGAE